jgi:hypothetical protein
MSASLVLRLVHPHVEGLPDVIELAMLPLTVGKPRSETP